jgi:uncharacterized protein (DUF934 family)
MALLHKSGAVIAQETPAVSLGQWRAEPHHRVVALEPHEQANLIGDDAHQLDEIEVRFEKYRDGRAFSTARELRERYGFKGQIRAAGHLVPDQFLFLVRVGVDAVVLNEGANVEQWRAALTRYTLAFQPSVTPTSPTAQLRRRIALS